MDKIHEIPNVDQWQRRNWIRGPRSGIHKQLHGPQRRQFCMHTMAGGGKRANGKRLRKAWDTAPQGGGQPQLKAGITATVGANHERRPAREFPGALEVAWADEEPPRG